MKQAKLKIFLLITALFLSLLDLAVAMHPNNDELSDSPSFKKAHQRKEELQDRKRKEDDKSHESKELGKDNKRLKSEYSTEIKGGDNEDSRKEDTIVAFISKPKEHIELLKSAIMSAKEKVVVVSPFISSWTLVENNIIETVKLATSLGSEVVIYTDNDLDNMKENAEKGRRLLFEAGADVRVVDRVHSKNLVVDDKYLTTGSFNWLSAVTEPANRYCRYETSTLMAGGETSSHIQQLLNELESLPVKNYKGYHSFYLEAKPARKGIFSTKNKLSAALQLYKKYKKDAYFGPITREILVDHADGHDATAITQVLKIFVNEGELFTGKPIQEIIRGLIDRCSDEEDFLDLAKAVKPISKEASYKIAEMMIPFIEPLQNVDDIVDELVNLGFVKLADEVEHEAYYSKDAAFASKH